MTLRAQIEPYLFVIEEMKPHYPAHWAELALDKDRPAAALDPDYAGYEMLAKMGRLVVATLRDETGALVGYWLCLVSPHLHYKSCLTATPDIYFVHPSVRGRFGGIRLGRCMERELRRRGVQRWFAGSKDHRDSGRLFKALGFRQVETYYSKWIGS